MKHMRLMPECFKVLDFSVLTEFSEDAVRERVFSLSGEELSGSRSALINRLHSELAVQMPRFRWTKTEVQESSAPGGCREFRLVTPMIDPNCIGWALVAPHEHPGTTVEADAERAELIIVQRFSEATAEEARRHFESGIERFHLAFEQAATEVERFNAALPYLISLWIEARLDGFQPATEVQSSRPSTVSSKGLGKMLDHMVADGDLTFVEELDPATGKLRKRYFAGKSSPKPN